MHVLQIFHLIDASNSLDIGIIEFTRYIPMNKLHLGIIKFVITKLWHFCPPSYLCAQLYIIYAGFGRGQEKKVRRLHLTAQYMRRIRTVTVRERKSEIKSKP